MSKKKYVIETAFENMGIQKIMQIGIDANCRIVHWTDSIENIEELNSDYINENYGELQDEAFDRGLTEAWELARLIWHDECGVRSKLGCVSIQGVFDKYTAQEAIAKLKAYEEKQKNDDKFEFGDEIIDSNGEKGCVVSKGNEEGDTIFALFSGYRTPQCIRRRNYRKTGKHYDIQSILEAMRT